jgi:large subunit ribosomal protein L53
VGFFYSAKMKTSYLTTLTARFNPFTPSAKVPRLVLSLLGPSAQKTVKISTTQLPRSSVEPSVLELRFKDGKTMKWAWGGEVVEGEKKKKQAGVKDIVEEVDRHARVLRRKEELAG